MEIEEKSVNVEVGIGEAYFDKADADDLCRLCANTDNQLIPIYRGEGLEHHISLKIEKHLPIIKVTEVDKLPLQICYQCASTLISWHNLYEGCLVADKKLREILAIEDDKLCQEDEAFGDYVDDYRDNYDDDTHETLPTSINTSNLESNTSKDNSTGIPVISETKAFNETDLDGSDERYVANRQPTSNLTDAKSFRSLPKFSVVFIDPSKCVKSTVKRHSAKPPKKRSAPIPVPIAPKPNILPYITLDQSVPSVSSLTSVPIAPAVTIETNLQRICKPSCDLCGQQFCARSSLNKHLKNASCLTKKYWRCDFCDQRFTTRDLSRAHVRDTHPDKVCNRSKNGNERCDLCSKTFSNVGNLNAHLRRKHPESVGPSIENASETSKTENVVRKPQKCNLCPKTFTTVGNLTVHIRRKHPETFVASAPRKKTSFESDPEALALFRSHRQVADDGSEILKCDKCLYATKLRYRFYDHYLIHTGERAYECDHCGKHFRTKWYVHKHIQCVHQGEKKFPCDICGRAFSDRRFTENHRRRHTGERPYVCEVCGKTFIQSGTLLVHKRFHFDIRNYECDICHKKFFRRGHMVLHIKRHKNIKDFVCEQCGKAFVDRRMLKDHEVVHSDLRPFSCELCGATFKLKKHLVQHGRTHRIS